MSIMFVFMFDFACSTGVFDIVTTHKHLDKSLFSSISYSIFDSGQM